MRLAAVLILAALLPSVAVADDLSEAYDICSQHTGALAAKRAFLSPDARTPKWEAGWEHCEQVDQVGKDRQDSMRRQRELDDLAKSRAIVDKLKAK